MKPVLLAAVLLGSSLFQVNAQAVTLPTDSVSQRVTFTGVVAAPGVPATALFSRAKVYALGGVACPLLEEEPKSVTNAWEKGIVYNGVVRILRYTVRITAREGRYRYELTDLTNKTTPSEYRDRYSSVTITQPEQQAPIEQVLANPVSYKKGKPFPELLAYRQVVLVAIEDAIRELQLGMRVASPSQQW